MATVEKKTLTKLFTGSDLSAASCHISQCLERSLTLRRVDSLTLADLLSSVTEPTVALSH